MANALLDKYPGYTPGSDAEMIQATADKYPKEQPAPASAAPVPASAVSTRSPVPLLPDSPPQGTDTGATTATADWRRNAGTPGQTTATPGVAAAGGATAGTSKAGTATAGQYNVTDDALVEKRIVGLLDQDSDYMKQARTQGLQQAAERGTLNSSMAVGAAQGAAMDRAFPIASQDAGTYLTAGVKNAEMSTQTSITNAQLATQSSIANAGNETQASVSNAGNETQASVASAQNQTSANIAGLNAATQRYISDSGIVANFNLEAMREDNALEQDYWRNIYAMNQNRAQSEDQFINDMEQLRVQEQGFMDRLLVDVDQRNRASFTESSGTLTQQYYQQRAELMMSTDFASETEKMAAIGEFDRAYHSNMETMAQTFNYTVDMTSMSTSDPAVVAVNDEIASLKGQFRYANRIPPMPPRANYGSDLEWKQAYAAILRQAKAGG